MTLKLDDFEPVDYPKMPVSINQSHILFEDGYAEGWARCISEMRKLGIAYTASQLQQLIDKCNAKDAELAAPVPDFNQKENKS